LEKNFLQPAIITSLSTFLTVAETVMKNLDVATRPKNPVNPMKNYRNFRFLRKNLINF